MTRVPARDYPKQPQLTGKRVPASAENRFSAVAATGCAAWSSYRIIGGLAVFTHEPQAYGNSLGDDECAAESAILDRLQAAGRA